MATIDIRVQNIDQMFDSLDPSPFHEKALSHDAEDYIVDFAGEYGAKEPLRLIIHAPPSIKPHAVEITDAVHAHFELAHAQCLRRHQRRMRIGRTSLVAGSAVLGIALLLRALLGQLGDRATIVAVREGLLILGWVAMWRPVDILLFDRLENHENSALLDRLARIPVDFELDVTEPGRSEKSGRATGDGAATLFASASAGIA